MRFSRSAATAAPSPGRILRSAAAPVLHACDNVRDGRKTLRRDVSRPFNTGRRAVGFDVGLPTHVIWEGHTMHVPMARLVGVLREVRDRIPRATICFDYLARDLVEKTTGDPALSVLAFRSETLCMPWTTGIADVRELARYLDCA